MGNTSDFGQPEGFEDTPVAGRGPAAAELLPTGRPFHPNPFGPLVPNLVPDTNIAGHILSSALPYSSHGADLALQILRERNSYPPDIVNAAHARLLKELS